MPSDTGSLWSTLAGQARRSSIGGCHSKVGVGHGTNRVVLEQIQQNLGPNPVKHCLVEVG